jgi:hypothetical protein
MVGKSLYVLIENGCRGSKLNVNGNKKEPADNRAQMESLLHWACIYYLPAYYNRRTPQSQDCSKGSGGKNRAEYGHLVDKKPFFALLVDKY